MEGVLKFILEKLGVRLALLAILLAVLWYVYSATQNNYRESRKDFLNLQLKTIQEIVDITSKIAVTNDEKEKSELVIKFWEYYHGKLTIVEDKNLAIAMVDFAKALSDKKTREPVDYYDLGKMYNRPINGAALRVAWAGRDVIYRGWTQNLLPWVQPELEGVNR